MNPRERITAKHALNCAWVTDRAPKVVPGVSLQNGFVEHLRTFQSANRLKKAVLHVIAGQMSEKQIKSLRDTFVALDVNGDGFLTVAEIRQGLLDGGLEDLPLDLNQIVADIDANGSGEIDYTEFLAATLQKKLFLQEDVCRQAFAVFDQNGDGKISQEELRQVLHNDGVEEALGAESIAELMQEVDGNGDGSIDFEEFMGMMRSGNSPSAAKNCAGGLTFGIDSAGRALSRQATKHSSISEGAQRFQPKPLLAKACTSGHLAMQCA
jgi:calcium-dependent protein kinase